jgi:hypothetical protein
MKITDFKAVYICPDHNEKYHTRKLHMDALLTKMGFKDIVHFKSGTESYPDCLAISIKNILTTYMDEPILLLEDDVEAINTIDFNYVESADAIYFGLSKWKGSFIKNEWEGTAQFECYSKNQVRILNMLSGHAILFISKQYKNAVIDAMNEAVRTKTYNDVMMSRIQNKFQVLANTVPTFYQSLKFNQGQTDTNNNVETSTKIAIDPDTLTVRQI